MTRAGKFTAAAAVILVGAVGAAWSGGFAAPFVYDDIPSLVLNPSIRRLWPPWSPLLPPSQGGLTVAGRPALNLSFALDYAVSGLRPWSYHLGNVLIHALAALALFGLVRRILALPWADRFWPAGGGKPGPAAPAAKAPDGPAWIALGTALLWALHPLQTESVTYVAQRAESLMGLFYLVTLYAFVRGAQATAGWRWYGVAVAACTLGMAAKEVMVSAPVLVFALDRAFIGGSFRGAWRRRRGVHVALASTWILLLFLVAWTHGRGDGKFDPGVGWGRYWLTQFGAVLHYLRLAVWPRPLIFDYGAQWVRVPLTVLPAAVLVGAFAVATAVACWRWPRAGFLGLFFFAILAPTSVIPGARQTLAEHRMYLALAPLAALAAWFAGTRFRTAGLAAVFAACLALGLATARRNQVYRSPLALWADTVRKRPGNPVAHHNYGMALYERGDFARAAAQYRQAIVLEPDYPKAHANLGAALLGMGRVAEGIAEYRTAIALRPDFEDAYYCLGEALAGSGHLNQAMAAYRRALALEPRDGPAHLGLAQALAQSGRLDEGLAEAEAASRCDPSSAMPHLEMGKMLAQEGRFDEARRELRIVLRIEPSADEARDILQRIQAYEGSAR